MGSAFSKRSTRRSQGWDDVISFMDVMGGRSIDLPGGGTMWFVTEFSSFRDSGRRKGPALPGRARHEPPSGLTVIGRAVAPGSKREFTVFVSDNYRVYGLERGTGLHAIADSLYDMIKNVGLSRRDLVVVCHHSSSELNLRRVTEDVDVRQNLSERARPDQRACVSRGTHPARGGNCLRSTVSDQAIAAMTNFISERMHIATAGATIPATYNVLDPATKLASITPVVAHRALPDTEQHTDDDDEDSDIKSVFF